MVLRCAARSLVLLLSSRRVRPPRRAFSSATLPAACSSSSAASASASASPSGAEALQVLQRGRFGVVICGGGVMGSSCAFWLARSGLVPASEIVVLEKDPTYRYASSALSASGIRVQFSTPENIRLSQYSFEFLRNAGEHLTTSAFGAPELCVRENGYLFLASKQGQHILEANHRTVVAEGGDVLLMQPDELAARFPWLNTKGLTGGTWGRHGEGWFDPYQLLMGFRRKAAELGVRFVHADVTGMTLAPDRASVSGVRVRVRGDTSPEGTHVACGTLVNAAGPGARLLAAMAGIDLCVVPRKRCVFVVQTEQPLPRGAECPLVIDPSGVYFRPEGSGFICGTSPPAHMDDDAYGDFDVDYNLFDEIVWPALAHRVPQFESIRQTGAWAGHYEYNTFDQNAIVGFHPRVRNYCFVNGFSGHGVQQSPAVGRAVSELIGTGRFQSIDLGKFDFARIAERRPIVEVNVV